MRALPKRLMLLGSICLLVAAGWGAWVNYSRDYAVYWIKTGSMEPLVKPDTLVIVRKREYAVGDVISFKVEGHVVTHVLRGFTPQGLTITKGLNNDSIDPWSVPRSAIVGHAVRGIYFGRLFDWLFGWLGILLLIVVVTAIGAGLWLLSGPETEPPSTVVQ